MLRQLYYYSKSLCVPIPYSNARASTTALFDLSNSLLHLAPIDVAFVRAHGILLSGKSGDQLEEPMETFIKRLDGHIAQSTKEWLKSGYVGTEMIFRLLLTHIGTISGFL